MPKLPIDKIRYAIARARKQKVPRMRIAVNDGKRTLLDKSQPGAKRGIENAVEHRSITVRKILSEIVHESRQLVAEAMNHCPDRAFGMQRTNGRTERRR